jgi:hypothetical protein
MFCHVYSVMFNIFPLLIFFCNFQNSIILASNAAISLSPIVGVGTGVAFTLIAIFLLLGLKSRRACSSPSNQPMTTSPPKKRSNNGQHQPKDSDMYEEKDPDLIPAKYLGTICLTKLIKNVADAK